MFFKENSRFEKEMVSTRSMYKKPCTDILRNAPPLSDGSKRQRRQRPEFVSIIRTRSQKKLRDYHDQMILAVAAFYNRKKKEPQLYSGDSSEVELATYLHNIRHTQLDVDLVLQISNDLPWFQWAVKKVEPKSAVLSTVAAILVIASFTALYVALQMNILQTERLVDWMNFAFADLNSWPETLVPEPTVNMLYNYRFNTVDRKPVKWNRVYA